MTRWFALIAMLWLATAPVMAAETLAYRGEAGQVAEYHVMVRATGQQVSLGERRPIHVEAEYEVREEVLSSDPDGNFRLRVTGRAVKVKDATRAFGGSRLDFPPVAVEVSPWGETLRADVLTPEGSHGMRGGAATALLAQCLPVITPSGPVEVGATWEWKKSGGRQTNRLVEIRDGIARITGLATAPLAFQERSEALGMTADVVGTQTQTSQLDLALGRGVAVRHKGVLDLRTKTEVRLESSEGPRTFPIQMSLRVEFDSRLVRLDGKPVGAP